MWEKMNYEITDCKIASRVFQNYLNNKDEEEFSSDKKKKKKDLKDYKFLYERLPKAKQRAVNHMIRNLLPAEILEQQFGYFFTKILEQMNMTTYGLAHLLCDKYSCDDYLEIDNEFSGKNVEDIRSKLENFTTTLKPQERSTILLLDICNIFSIELDVLLTGTGLSYSIDEEFIKKVLQERNIETQTFYENIVLEYLNDCKKCRKNKACEWQNEVVRFKQLDKKALGDFIAYKLNVNSDEVVIANDLVLELDEFPLDSFFKKLKFKEQIAVQRLISDLHMSEIPED